VNGPLETRGNYFSLSSELSETLVHVRTCTTLGEFWLSDQYVNYGINVGFTRAWAYWTRVTVCAIHRHNLVVLAVALLLLLQSVAAATPQQQIAALELEAEVQVTGTSQAWTTAS